MGVEVGGCGGRGRREKGVAGRRGGAKTALRRLVNARNTSPYTDLENLPSRLDSCTHQLQEPFAEVALHSLARMYGQAWSVKDFS